MTSFSPGYFRLEVAPGQRIIAWCCEVRTESGRVAIGAFRSQAAAKDPAKAIGTYTPAEFAAVAVEAISPLAAG